MIIVTLLAAMLGFAAQASAASIGAKRKAEAVDPAEFGALTHLVVVGGATRYEPAQEELLGRIEAALRQSGCWRLMDHGAARERIPHAALPAPSPSDWNDDEQVSAALLDKLAQRDERLGLLIFWVTSWQGRTASHEALAQIFDSASGDQVWRARLLIPEGAAGDDASEYELFAAFFADNLRHPPNLESACRPRADAPARAGAMPRGADAVLRAAAQLRSGSAGVRVQAAQDLRRIGGDAAVSPLIQALSDPDFQVRAYALDALGLIGDPEAVGAIVSKLIDPSSLLRALAARALGRIGSPQAAPALAKLLNTETEPRVRRAAEAALDKVGPVAGMMNDSRDGFGRP